MLLRLLLTNAGFIAGAVIEGVLAVVALILIILVAKYGLPNFEKREPKPKREKPQPVTYALTYAAGGGTGESPAVEEYVKGAKITQICSSLQTAKYLPVGTTVPKSIWQAQNFLCPHNR